MAALLALGYSMLVQEQEKKDDASDTPAATHNPSVSTSSLPQVTTPDPSASIQATKSTRSSATRSSTVKGEADSESSRKGSSRRQKMHASTKALDDQYAKQMAKVAKLMRKMERAEQREKNARWKAAMQDITQAREAGIDPQKDKVGWDDDSDNEDTLHPADASLKKPITNLSAKPDDSDGPAPESGDTLARFIHAMFSSMNPFEEAAHVEKGDDSATDPAASKSTEGSSKPASKDPKDQQASEEVLRLLSSASTMNQASQSRGSVWNVLDRLTPGRSKKAGPNDAEGSLMISAPLFITEDSKVEVAKSSMRTIEEHDSDSEDSKPRSSKFANLVNKMGMDGVFGSKKKSEEESAEAEVAEVKAEPEPRPVKEVRVWQPSADGISLQCSWWGYRIYLPPPVLAVLNDQKLEAAKRAALVTTALQWMIDHVPTALLPPQLGLLMSLIRGIIPALGYIGGFVAWSWSAIIGFDEGNGVILSATWLLPIALIPGAWDVDPVHPTAKEIEPEPAPVAEAKTTKSSLSRSASFAKKMPSLERKPSTKSSSSGSKEKKAERKGLERSATEATAIPKRPSEPTRRPTAGPLPTPPSSFPRASGISRSQSSTPPVTKVKESKDPKPEADRPALKKTPSKMGLNIVWSDKPVSEEPKDDEETEKKPSFKLPMPDVTWDHERKAAEAEAAAKLAAEQQAKDAAKAKLKNKYAQALREQMAKDKAPVGCFYHQRHFTHQYPTPTHTDVDIITQDTWPKEKAQIRRMLINKENRAKSRETATLKKDTSGLETEIHELENIGEDKLNATQKSRLKELRTEVDRIRKIKQDYVKAHPEQSHLVRGLNPRARHSAAGDGASASAGGSVPATRSLFGKNGLPLRPERSIYYDPVLNPYGVPPPGMPYAERPLLPHEMEDDDQQGTLDEDSAMNSGSDESEGKSGSFMVALPRLTATVDESDDDDDDDDIVLPAGPPPDQPRDASDDESSDSGSDDDIPMPAGPPPPKAAPPLPAGVPPAVPFPPSIPYGATLPPFPPTAQPVAYMPYVPPPPPGFPSNIPAGHAPYFVQPTGPYPPQMPFAGPPRDRQFAEAVRVVQDPLSNVPHVTFQAHQAQRHQPPPATASLPHGLPPKPGSVPQAAASATISAEPELRDFKKEATAFVPTSMRRAAKKGANAGAPSGIKIDAAPNEMGDDHGGPSAEPRKDLMSVLGSQLGVPDKPSAASNNKGGQGKDDYEKFLAEVGSFL